MNYFELSQAIQNYAENTESLFVASIPTFVKETERRIYNSVQIPALRRNVTGTMTLNNKYISLPDDWLANYSLAVIDATGSYHFMINKDVNFMRESYPNPNTLGLPKYYALFGSQINNTNELSLVMGPTPDASYDMELHYFYYPVSIVQRVLTDIAITSPGTGYNTGTYYNVPLTGGSGMFATANIVVSGGGVTSITVADGGSLYVVGDVLTVNNSYIGGAGTLFSASAITVANTAGTSWLGDNYDPVLFYGAMREAVLFMKGEQDMVAYYQKMYEEAMSQLNRLGTGLERGDAYRDGQAKINKVNP